jgi:hypothetical protein
MARVEQNKVNFKILGKWNLYCPTLKPGDNDSMWLARNHRVKTSDGNRTAQTTNIAVRRTKVILGIKIALNLFSDATHGHIS